jgi:hypothetical protein
VGYEGHWIQLASWWCGFSTAVVDYTQ